MKVLAAFALLGALTTGAAVGLQPAPPDWQEVAWPFGRDAWPAGRAFRCGSAACGGILNVYVRAKIGFCNCGTGVRGDDEVDAVSDVDMISADFRTAGPGEPVVVAGMAGRARSYDLRADGGAFEPAVGLAVSHRCDLVVAAVTGPASASPAARRTVAALLETRSVAAWIRSLLGEADRGSS